MKSYVTFVMTLYEGIFQDAAIQLSDTRVSMEKDLSYLRRCIKQRGLAFFTLTLPDFGSWIDRSLDQGSFADASDIPRGIPLFRGRPRLFWGILMKVFDASGMLRPDADHWSVLLLRTLCQCMKKLETPVKPLALKKTVKEFFDVEEHLPKSHPDTWDDDTPKWKERMGHPLAGESRTCSPGQPLLFGCPGSLDTLVPWDTLRVLSRRVTSELGCPDWWSLRPKHGPGVVSEKGWVSKFEFPIWPRKLEQWFPFDWFGSGNLDVPETVPDDKEPFSKLIAVPKTSKGPRLICAEPLAHQWIQQSIWCWLEERIPSTLLRYSISFRSQEASQLAALRGSLDGSVATLDLSAASDRLSTRLVEYIFQGSDVLNGMHACRTRAMEQTLEGELSKLIILRKFATMGSALTFPVQSIVFTILTVWALRLAEKRERDWHLGRLKRDFARVRVFGDDIIVPTHAYEMTKLVLHECGLLVNIRKSYGGVSFRESCGMDAFRGVDVTPPRVHKDPCSGSASSMAALTELSNNLYKKGYWYASDRVLGFLPDSVRDGLVVGGPEESGIGLFTFGKSDLDNRKRRRDPAVQRDYVLRIAFTTQATRHRGRCASDLIQFFHEEPARRNPLRQLSDAEPKRDGGRLYGLHSESRDSGRGLGQSYGDIRLVKLDGSWDWSAGSVSTSKLRIRKLRVYL